MNIEDLPVSAWLPLPDVAERLGTDVSTVRTIIRDGRLLAAPVGERRVRCVPAEFLVPGKGDHPVVLAALAGTLALLADAGYTEEESLIWLFTPDPSLETLGPTGANGPATPIAALIGGFKGEVLRRAQSLGF